MKTPKKTTPSVVCENPSCVESFKPIRRDHNYCSPRCRKEHWDILNRPRITPKRKEVV